MSLLVPAEDVSNDKNDTSNQKSSDSGLENMRMDSTIQTRGKRVLGKGRILSG